MDGLTIASVVLVVLLVRGGTILVELTDTGGRVTDAVVAVVGAAIGLVVEFEEGMGLDETLLVLVMFNVTWVVVVVLPEGTGLPEDIGVGVLGPLWEPPFLLEALPPLNGGVP